ncbi:hypothetical protein [Sphingomonas sp.]|uniref:hypothetical protein n=1 Tax=Sphingomonas sp. TaxID=28214 RepID=UPI003AFFC61B
MTFEEVSAEAQGFVDLVASRTGRHLIQVVTVPEPAGAPDELHFVRIVSWGYVLLNEAGSVMFKELARSLKSSRPEVSKTYQDGKRDIEALRTMLSHNLAEASRANERTRRIAEAWLLQNGAPGNWPIRCNNLCRTLHAMLLGLRGAFAQLCEEGEDGQVGVDQLLAAVDRAWPPHLFDGVVSSIAEEVGLPSLEAVEFRKPRQEEWMKLVALFPTRAEASEALERVIRAEMHRIFGPARG